MDNSVDPNSLGVITENYSDGARERDQTCPLPLCERFELAPLRRSRRKGVGATLGAFLSSIMMLSLLPSASF